MVCESCQSELEAVMVICPACGVRVEHGREDVHWRQQVRDTVERHKAKRRREQTKHDDEARQLTIFPESSEQDEEDRAVRARRAEIRARVEERMSKRRNTPSSLGARSYRGGVSSGGGAIAARALVRSTDLDPADLLDPVARMESTTDVAEERVIDPRTAEFAPDELAGEADLEIAREALLPDVSAPSAEPFIGFGLASPGERVLSGFIDMAFVSLIQLTLFYLTTHLVAQRLGALPTSALVAMGLVGAVLGAGYFLFFWSLSGQTLGKLLTGGRVVDGGGGGGALGASRAALRLAGAVLSAVPLGAGFLGLWTDTDRRGWHDRLAGTKVVRG